MNESNVSPLSSDHVRKNIRVLLVEDNEHVRRVLQSFLRDAGYAVQGCESGDEALVELVSEQGFELVITDLVLPGSLSGNLLAAASRSIHPNLCIIFISGYPPEAMVHCHGVESEDVRIMKPVDRHVLLESVRMVLRRKQHREVST